MPRPRSYHHSQPSNYYGYREYQMSTYGSQPQRYPHQVRALPGHMWYLPQMVPNTSNTGWCGRGRVIPDEKLPVPPKGNKCEYRCTHSAGTSVKESDSSLIQNPLSTDNNKGGSVPNSPKPTINLVPKKDVTGGDATTSCDSKDYH